VALLYDHRAFQHVAWTEMMAEDLMLVVPPHAALAHESAVAFKSIFRLPLVLPGRPNVLRTLIEQLAVRHDVAFRAIDCDSLPAIVRLVRQAGHVTIMPHFACADELARGEVVAVPIVDPTPSWRLSVVVSQRTMNMRGAEAVAEVMADVIATMVENKTWHARLIGERTAAAPA
jgi:LysR family transcriptional regulator, nitrogen assimilation regulatory protein